MAEDLNHGLSGRICMIVRDERFSSVSSGQVEAGGLFGMRDMNDFVLLGNLSLMSSTPFLSHIPYVPVASSRCSPLLLAIGWMQGLVCIL
jgi:hypothetical protein